MNSLVLSLLALAGYSITSASKSGKGFFDYEDIAKTSLIASSIQANMLVASMSIKDDLVNQSKEDIEAFKHYSQETQKFIDEALENIKTADRLTYIKNMNQNFSCALREHIR